MAPLRRYPLSPLNPNRSLHPSLSQYPNGSLSLPAHLSKPANCPQGPAVPNPRPLISRSSHIFHGRKIPNRDLLNAAAPAADDLKPDSYCSTNPNLRSAEGPNLTKMREEASPSYVIASTLYRRMSKYGNSFTCNDDEGSSKHYHGAYKPSTSLGGACRNLKFDHPDLAQAHRSPNPNHNGKAQRPRHESRLSCDYDNQRLSLDEHPMQFLHSHKKGEGSTQMITCLNHGDSAHQRKNRLGGSKSFNSSNSSKSKCSHIHASKSDTFSKEETFVEGKVDQHIEKELCEQGCKKTPHLKSPQIPSHLLQDRCLDTIMDRAWHYHNVGEPLSPYTRITLCNHLSSFSSRKFSNSLWATRLRRLVSWRL